MIKRYIPLLLVALLLSACSSKQLFGWKRDHWENQSFKPYIENNAYTQPASVNDPAWIYAQGTSPQAVAEQLKASDIILKVAQERHTLFDRHNGAMVVVVGPNFYKLSAGGKKEVMKLTDSMYHLSDQKTAVFLRDWRTRQVIGQYTKGNLLLN